MGWDYRGQLAGKMNRHELTRFIEDEHTYYTVGGARVSVVDMRVSSKKAHLICKKEGATCEYFGVTDLIDNGVREVGIKTLGADVCTGFPVAMARKLIKLNGEGWQGHEADAIREIIDRHRATAGLRKRLKNGKIGDALTLKHHDGTVRTYTLGHTSRAKTGWIYRDNGERYYTPRTVLERDWELV